MADDDYKQYGKAVKGESKAAAATRKSKFYTGQRKADEAKASRGDSSAGEELMSIGRKRGGEGGKRDQQIGARARLGMNQDEAAGRMRDPSGMKKKLASVTGPALLGEGLGGAIGAAVRAAGAGVGRFFPEAAGMARQGALTARKALPGGKTAATNASKTARYTKMGDRKAQEVARQQKGSARPKAASPPQKLPPARPVARGGDGKQLALPKPKGESPKMQHSKVTAGKPRSKQGTVRNKGTNARATGTSPRAMKKKAAKKADS